MVDPNNNFEEFEFDDDLDESWEDVLDEDTLPNGNDVDFDTGAALANTSKAKPMIKFVLLLSLLIGASFGAYSFMVISHEEKNIPIIKLDKHSIMNARQPETTDAINIRQLNVADNKASHSGAGINTETPPALQKEATHNTVLTPMPNGTDGKGIALPNLNPENIDKNSINTPINSKASNSRTLSEDDLLSKTESLYEVEKTEIIAPIHKLDEAEPVLAPENKESIADTAVEQALIEGNVIIATPVKDTILPSVKPLAPQKTTASNPAQTPAKINKASTDVLKSSKKITWTIRAAQPGNAVIYDKINKEMKSVEVNDTLPNIGRITSIRLKNGRWIITGTKGNISQ